MIRLVVIWNIVVTSLLAAFLLSDHVGLLHKAPPQAGVSQIDVLRVRRVEVVDHEGHLTAVLGEGLDGYVPASGLTLLDPQGRKAVILALNDRGYGTLYFQSKQMEGKVSVGYFTGSDEVAPLSDEDPGGMWGIRVLRPNLDAPQVFGTRVDGRPIHTSP